MKQLLHILFITEEDAELHLKKETIVIKQGEETKATLPLINLEGIVNFSFRQTTAQLMEELCRRNINYSAVSKYGRLRFRTLGETHGNPLLRLQQYQLFLNEEKRLETAKIMIKSKIRNSTVFLKRFAKNHSFAKEQLENSIDMLNTCIDEIDLCLDNSEIRGVEGTAARIYYSNFDSMILSDDEKMKFEKRSKRPPENRFNALLSLSYTIVTEMCKSALETVGIDPYFGALHEIRSGNAALAYDLVEEMRAVICDRFVFRAINLKIIDSGDFESDDELFLSKEGKKKFFAEWNKYIFTEVRVNSSEEKIPIGLLPYYRASEFSGFLREDNTALCPFGVNLL